MSDSFQPLALAAPEDHVRGNHDARVTIVEYGDYECPYCAAAAPVLHDLVDGSDGAVRLVFRNFPIYRLHPYALTAALAAEAAAPAGAFWQMHDVLFRHQDRLTDADLSRYAESLGLDGASVVGESAQPFGDRIEQDFASAVELGVPGTPTLYVDGVAYQGRLDATSLRQATSPSAGAGRLVPRPRRQRWRGLLGGR